MKNRVKNGAKVLFLLVLGFLTGILLIFIYYAANRQDLHTWHTEELSAEVTAKEINRMSSLQEYLEQEHLLFNQLDQQIINRRPDQPGSILDRYSKGSWSNRASVAPNWNGTIKLSVAAPRARILMLHGLSDSPYSLRALAERLHRDGCDVTVLRLPGHGTVPSGLTRVQWQDFTAAVRLAAQDLTANAPETPFYLVGYSNGATLAVEYTLATMLGEKGHLPDGIFMISPALTVSPTAALAKWNLLLARLTGLKKLAWLSIEPEYDPYKYNSFPINAGKQIYLLTRHIQRQIAKIDKGNGLEGFPPVMAFLSVVDATIPPQGLIDSFMIKLTPNDHNLVLFDVNRIAADTALMKNDGSRLVKDMMSRKLPFTVSLLTNKGGKERNLEIQEKKATRTEIQYIPTDFSWPTGIYSLSHVALPFPPTDPVYGVHQTDDFTLGLLEPKGEKNVLLIPASNLLRLRYNPFYDLVEQQIRSRIVSD